MLCVFQVNHGEFLTISDEIQPTSRYGVTKFIRIRIDVCEILLPNRVHELSVALSRHHKISEDKQVLLTHEGRLLESQEMIGAYGVGTVGVTCLYSIVLYKMN